VYKYLSGAVKVFLISEALICQVFLKSGFHSRHNRSGTSQWISGVAREGRWGQPPPRAPRLLGAKMKTKVLKLFINVSPHFEGLLKLFFKKCEI